MTLAAGLFTFGCSDTTPVPPPPIKPPYTYTVGAGDVLAVSVWKETELQKQDVTVQPGGDITFPLVGTLHVQKKTLAEVAKEIRDRLLVHMPSPIVSVALVRSNSAQVQVVGEVRVQQPVGFRDGLSVVQAIMLAGGPIWPFAKTGDVRVIRGALDDPLYIPVDLHEVLKGNEKDVFLMPGDIVVVPAKNVTRMNRYVTQLLSPILGSAQAGASSASTAITAGESALVSPGP